MTLISSESGPSGSLAPMQSLLMPLSATNESGNLGLAAWRGQELGLPRARGLKRLWRPSDAIGRAFSSGIANPLYPYATIAEGRNSDRLCLGQWLRYQFHLAPT
jgi:hypothetical protein